MRIPFVPVSGKRDSFFSGKPVFSGCLPRIEVPEDYIGAVRRAHADSDGTKMMAVLDVDGLRERFMNTDLLKSKRAKGRTVMFITHVSGEDDVLDGMCGSYDVLGIPYHTADREVLRCALELSDTVTPVIFCSDGREVSSGRSADSARAEMRAAGFPRICFYDISEGTMDYEDSALSISSDIISMA